MEVFRRYFIIGGLFVFGVFISIYLFLAFYVGISAGFDTKVNSDAILVLGAKSYKGDSYNPCLVSRVTHAAQLYKAKYAPKIIVSGGNDGEDGVNEAETMKQIAINLGVNPEDILLEKKATSTFENFTYSKDILKDNNLNSVIIVTEPFHIKRAALVADKLGLNYTVSPASESPCWTKWKYLSRYFLKEPLAIIWYKFQNKL
jgi:uncharacterized SAM-binding protein YcdF (DUF218 family)